MEPSQLRAPIYGEEISALDAGAREAGTRLRLFRRRFLGRGATWGRVDRVVKRERRREGERWSPLLRLLSSFSLTVFLPLSKVFESKEH